MPGTPDPVLGSALATHAVAVAASAAVVVIAYRFRAVAPPRTVAVGGGLAYAVAAVLLWAVVRLAAGTFSRLSTSSATLAGLAVATGVVVFLHAGLALYLQARWGYLTPSAVLFGATYLVAWLFLHVRGETDPVGLYWILFGPLVLAALLALAGVEYGVRAVLGG